MTRNTDSTDSETPTGTGIAWAIQQITKHFDNLSGANVMPIEATLSKRLAPSQPILSAVPVLAEPIKGEDSIGSPTARSSRGSPKGEARESNDSRDRTQDSDDSRRRRSKTLEQEFYRPGDFGIKVVAAIDYSGSLDKPQDQTPEETGHCVICNRELPFTAAWLPTCTLWGMSCQNFVGETLVQKEKMDDLWKQ